MLWKWTGTIILRCTLRLWWVQKECSDFGIFRVSIHLRNSIKSLETLCCWFCSIGASCKESGTSIRAIVVRKWTSKSCKPSFGFWAIRQQRGWFPTNSCIPAAMERGYLERSPFRFWNGGELEQTHSSLSGRAISSPTVLSVVGACADSIAGISGSKPRIPRHRARSATGQFGLWRVHTESDTHLKLGRLSESVH